MADASDNLLAQMNEMLLQVARSKSGDALLTVSIDQVLRQADPRKAEVLRRCAVPRWFDASVLALLRGKEDENERYLARIREYTFVRDMGDGRLAFHDQVRETLLADWRETRPDELRDLHVRLYEYFSRRTTPIGSVRYPRALMPESMAVSSVPMSAQADLWRREAIYHLLAADEGRGLAALQGAFDELLENHRLAEAELLLRTADEAHAGPQTASWVAFLRARALQAGLNLQGAEARLEALLAEEGLAPELGAEASRALGEVRAETGQWARATSLYYHSLTYFEGIGDRQAVADTMLLLGEAYQNLGISTGSWHVSRVSANPLVRFLQQAWVWLLSLPFMLMNVAASRGNPALPRADYCARYQNWLLIRLYNAARLWYLRAREEYRALGSEIGVLRAEQRLADILLLYGYHAEALGRITALLKRPPARDAYRRAWLKRSLAEAYLAAGKVDDARDTLAAALQIFKEIGDVRREASVRALQGRVEALSGDVTAAIASYRDSLDRFRELRYAAARERILHDLRAWQSDPGLSPEAAGKIEALITAEPEKRYVGRFISSALPVLQVASALALPIALLLLAAIVPTTELARLPGELFGLSTVYDPLRVAVTLTLLVPCYLAAYGALAAVVVFVLPMDRIEREQPDVIVTRPEGITRSNHHGDEVLTFGWGQVRRWLALDRATWDRPLPLYSRSFLESEAGEDMAIEGIMGWYTHLQADIRRRLGRVGSAVRREDMGYRLLKSKCGLSAVVGGLLLIALSVAENRWLGVIWVPPPLYALLYIVAFSGALVLFPAFYWLAYRPLRLQRALRLSEAWPLLIGAIGAIPIVAYPFGGLTSQAELDMAALVWGAAMVAEAAIARFELRGALPRAAARATAIALALAVIAQPAFRSYQTALSRAALVQAGAEASQGAPDPIKAQAGYDAAGQARDMGADPYATYMLQGNAGFYAGDYAAAAESYRRAADWAPGPGERALAFYNLSRAYELAGDEERASEAWDRWEAICAESPGGEICPGLGRRR